MFQSFYTSKKTQSEKHEFLWRFNHSYLTLTNTEGEDGEKTS